MIKIMSRNRFDANDARRVIELLGRKYGISQQSAVGSQQLPVSSPQSAVGSVEKIHEFSLHDGNGHGEDCGCDFHKSLSSMPGVGHPVPVIGRMELEIYRLIDWEKFLRNLFRFLGLRIKKSAVSHKPSAISSQQSAEVIYKPDGSTFSLAELEVINDFIRQELKIAPAAIEAAVVRSYIIGNIISAMQEAKQAKATLDFAALPKTVVEMAKKYKLTQQEINSVNYAISNVGNQIAGITDEARKIVAQKVIEARFQGKGHEELALDLYHEVTDSEKNLNRDWRRVSITEGNAVTNNGFLGACEEGEQVIGVSQPGACDWCKEHIDGKIFTVIKNHPPDYRNLDSSSDEYKKVSKIYDTCLWVGKTNMGRSNSPKKKTGEGDYETRYHHEMWTVCFPAHPYGRCYPKKLIK